MIHDDLQPYLVYIYICVCVIRVFLNLSTKYPLHWHLCMDVARFITIHMRILCLKTALVRQKVVSVIISYSN